MEQISICSNFDGGSVEIVDISDLQNLRFKIRKDTNSNFAQWFYFKVNNIANKDLNFTFIDLDQTAYPEGWDNYNVCVSFDNRNWFRVPTKFAKNQISFKINAQTFDSVYIAYFEPYPYMRHADLLGFVANSAYGNKTVKCESLGLTHQGRSIDLVQVGESNAKHKVWIIASQHPGETMARWFMEGFIYRLLDRFDGISNKLLKDCVFYLVPNVNPDGAALGNLRVNSVGVNLNREWQTPTMERSPEIIAIQAKMKQTGVDMFFDIHGDEAIPYIFRADCDEIPNYSQKQQEMAHKFEQVLLEVNPDFQLKHGYEKGHFNEETLTLANNWVGQTYGCLSIVIEMPFKDNDNAPDLQYGWNGRRSSLFGAGFLTAISMLI